MSDFEKLINASDLIDWIIETDPEWCIGTVRSIVDHIENMPSAQLESCEYWDSESNFCALCRPSAQLEHTMEEFMYGQDMGNPEDGSL